VSPDRSAGSPAQDRQKIAVGLSGCSSGNTVGAHSLFACGWRIRINYKKALGVLLSPVGEALKPLKETGRNFTLELQLFGW
jgi:hypothetical protein